MTGSRRSSNQSIGSLVSVSIIMDNAARIRQGGMFAQDDMLFENENGYYTEVLAGSLPRKVGRALATADVDGDGDMDILITNNDDDAQLILNVAPRKGTAVGLKLEGTPPASNRDAYGARVTWMAFGRERMREVRAGASYCASNDPRLLLAVATGTRAVTVKIRWPGGRQESHDLAPGSYHHIIEGKGVQRSVPFR